jgi:cysteine sulfinate desulfinase/cysteine desulfurase-like protein
MKRAIPWRRSSGQGRTRSSLPAGGTESDNLAILGLARQHAKRGKHVITCATEHHAVLHACEHLQKREGFRVSFLPVNCLGRVDPAQVADAITPETSLVSIMTANNETGTLQPVGEIAGVCRERGVLFHSDAIQSFGKQPLRAGDFDALSLAAHKFHGPKGAGLLYLRSGLSLERLQHGGSHENERRPGTENVAAIAGMAAAARLAVQGIEGEAAREAALRDKLWAGIHRVFPEAVRNGHPSECLANTLNVSFPGSRRRRPDHRARSRRHCGFQRISLHGRLGGAFSRPARDGCGAGRGPGDRAVLAWKQIMDAEIDATIERLEGVLTRLRAAANV